MYKDRKRAKEIQLRTMADEYLMTRINEYIDKTGLQRQVVIREWIEAGLERDRQRLLEDKNNQFVTEL